jgi:hypothetical protein
MAVSKRLRYEILRRDNHACRYCGATAPGVRLTIDHVTPEALGGTDTPDNLVTACADCNNGKTSTTPDAALVADVSQDALRWAAAMKQAAEVLRAQEAPKLEYRAAFETEWNQWTFGRGAKGKPLELPAGWKASLERFRAAGLPAWAWEDIVDTAMGNDKVRPENVFRYCCGTAWNKVHALQKEASHQVGRQEHSPTAESVQAAVASAWANSFEHRVQQEPRPEDIENIKEVVKLGLEVGVTPDAMLDAAIAAGACGSPHFGLHMRRDPEEAVRIEEATQVWLTNWRLATGGGPPTWEDFELFQNSVDMEVDGEFTQFQIVQAAARAGEARRVDIRPFLTAGRETNGGQR